MESTPDKEAFLRLVQENRGIIIKICRSYCRDKNDREDLAQDIIYQLWKSGHRFNADYKFSTWMYRVALNVAISYYRKEKRSKPVISITGIDMDIEDKAEDGTHTEDNIRLLQAFISDLKDLDRALMLLYLEEKTYSEIAEIIGISETNTATRISRIKEKLNRPLRIIPLVVILAANLYAIGVFIRQLVLIRQINNSESIVQTQLKLAGLQGSTIHIVRILFLQTPFFIILFYPPSSIVFAMPGFWVISLPLTLLLIVVTIWLYRNISYKNLNKKWLRLLLGGREWNYIIRSMDFIKEIEEFKNNI